MSRRDISLQIHNTLFESMNTMRETLGLSPRVDHGCAYDRIESAKRRQVENAYCYDEDEEYNSPCEEDKKEEEDDSYDAFIDFLSRL